MAKPYFAFSTKPLGVTFVVVFLRETPSTYTLMKILELERVKELLTMTFQCRMSHLVR